MKLSKKTLEKLREIINGDGTDYYRSGPQLVRFFNQLGFNDVYKSGFPSRWQYTDSKLESINGKPELDECIRMTFSVIDFVDNIDELDKLMESFNKYLAFDKWQVVRDNHKIQFNRLDRVIVDNPKRVDARSDEEMFLSQEFDINIEKLCLESDMNEIIRLRLGEVEACINGKAPLAAIILIGSIIEGILLGEMSRYQKEFNQAQCAPKDKQSGKNKQFQHWSLNEMINAATEIGMLKRDVQKFSHAVRDFRNYIHPYQQMISKFSPDIHTVKICFQVLKAAIYQIGEYRRLNG